MTLKDQFEVVVWVAFKALKGRELYHKHDPAADTVI